MSTATTKVDTITVTINGQTIQVPKGTRIIQAAEMLGIEIPTFCYQPRMRPNAACRICTVEVTKPMNKMFMACATEMMDGMEVLTDSERTLKDRQTNLDLLLTQHPLDCPVCDKGGECKLQDYSVKYGSFENPFETKRKDFPEDIRSVALDFNSNRCILCGGCIQVCGDIQQVDAIGFSKRGFITVVGAPMGEALDCEFCGQCMDVCPVGAITSRFAKYKFRPWQEEKTQTTCTYCGCGCQYDLRTVDGEASRVTPIEGVGPGQGSLCVRGHFGYHFMEDDRRITRPLVRRGDKLVETTWEEAVSEAARGLAGAKAAGAGRVAGIAGGRLTNEEQYLFGRLVRDVLGSSNLDSSLRYGAINGVTVTREALGVTGMMNSFDEVRAADAVLLIGCDITQEAPILGLAVKEAIHKGEKPVLVADSMKTEIMKRGAGRLVYTPGTEIAVIKGLVKAVVDEGLIDEQVAKKYPKAVQALRSELSGTYKEIETPTGLKKDDIVALAKRFAAASKGIILAGPRVTGGLKGKSAMTMLVDLAFLTGGLTTPGAGVNAITMENNELGLALNGMAPELVPGGGSWDDAEARGKVATAWNCSLPNHQGDTMMEMFDAMREGRISAAIVAGTDPVGRLPQDAGAAEALGALDCLVVSDLFLSETAKRAHVVFPARSYAEKDGTVTNMEGRVQTITSCMKAPGKAASDWKIVSDIAREMGHPLEYANPGEIRAEAAALVPQFADTDVTNAARGGVSTEALEAWLAGGFGTGMGERYDLPAKLNEASGHEMRLYVGELLFHSGSMSTYNWGLMKINDAASLQLNSREARKLKIKEGDRVRLTGDRGSCVVTAKPDPNIMPGTLFFPRHSVLDDVRNLVQVVEGSEEEGSVPQFRFTRVTMEKVSGVAEAEASA
ncbi:MAG: molybdopterin-dependent oxidoreductase [Nitrospirota bacterium]|nr:molybdopterin-dependent oxidoreductase [Nitrospirota bacterium]